MIGLGLGDFILVLAQSCVTLGKSLKSNPQLSCLYDDKIGLDPFQFW